MSELLLRTTIAVSLALGMAACSSGEVQPVYDGSAAIAQRDFEGFAAAPTGKIDLTVGNFCAWTPEFPMTQPPSQQLMLDGRCAAPIPGRESEFDNSSVEMFAQPKQEGAATKIENGKYITSLCFTTGQNVLDGRGEASQMWIRITAEPEGRGAKGFVSALATGYVLPADPCK